MGTCGPSRCRGENVVRGLSWSATAWAVRMDSQLARCEREAVERATPAPRIQGRSLGEEIPRGIAVDLTKGAYRVWCGERTIPMRSGRHPPRRGWCCGSIAPPRVVPGSTRPPRTSLTDGPAIYRETHASCPVAGSGHSHPQAFQARYGQKDSAEGFLGAECDRVFQVTDAVSP